MLVLCLLLFALPDAVFAQANAPATNNTVISAPDPKTGLVTICGINNNGSGFTSRIMTCVRDTIVNATNNFLGPFSQYLASTVTAAITLAIVIWGIKVMGGKPMDLSAAGIILGLKIGGVLMFTTNFGGMFPMLLDMLNGLLGIIANSVRGELKGCPNMGGNSADANILFVWGYVDCYIDRLIGGVFSPFSLTFGIVGFLIGVLLSSSLGLFVALMGFILIVFILFSIARALYIMVTAYIALALMVVISPITIPTILFQYTKGIFEKWLKITIGFMIQPIFMFGYLCMFLVAFNMVVFTGQNSLYYAIAGKASLEENFKLGKWLTGNGNDSQSVYTEKSLDQTFTTVNTKEAVNELGFFNQSKAGQPGIKGTPGLEKVDETLKRGFSRGIATHLGVGATARDIDGNPTAPLRFFKTDVPVNVVSWRKLAERADPEGYNSAKNSDEKKDEFYQNYKIKIFMAFLMAVIVIYIFYAMLEYLPFIAAGVTGEGMNMKPFGTGATRMPGSQIMTSKGGGK